MTDDRHRHQYEDRDGGHGGSREARRAQHGSSEEGRPPASQRVNLTARGARLRAM
jgi:hypothetical protein